jgi:hypothetical protein
MFADMITVTSLLVDDRDIDIGLKLRYSTSVLPRVFWWLLWPPKVERQDGENIRKQHNDSCNSYG